MKTTIGGDRLGSGNKQEVSFKTYNRSTHDLSYLWRSSMSSGTLVPFMSEVGLPGDSFDIDLGCEVLTLPTTGPLFGSYKVQLDIFSCPVRLYNGKLHMNKLGIGMDMSQIKLPQLKMEAGKASEFGDNSQINPSCIFSYLNIRGLGRSETAKAARDFNALSFLSYWDIYKQYYANKQEEKGAIIHVAPGEPSNFTIDEAYVTVTGQKYNILLEQRTFTPSNTTLTLKVSGGEGIPDYSQAEIQMFNPPGTQLIDSVFGNKTISPDGLSCTWAAGASGTSTQAQVDPQYIPGSLIPVPQGKPIVTTFDLKAIDDMREDILKAVSNTTAFEITKDSPVPYGAPLQVSDDGTIYAKLYNQEGLGLKTYQSDLFNNWISTEWIDGTNGVNEVTAVDTSEGKFTIDALNLASKVYVMLNRIAISGGTYDDWLDAVYTHERSRSVENPVYQGSLIKELSFQEVISNSDAEFTQGETTINQPLGTLAGRGKLTGKHKGGSIKVKIDEPSYVMGIVSLTPRIDFSQGNKWDTNLKTMNDFHKPALDAIGYQDLITDQMAWFDTTVTDDPSVDPVFKSAGKQPAWINYMTNVNQVRGNFADKNSEMFMVLNRRYEQGPDGIDDLTTYIDPSKFNHVFADTRLDAQNFWVQISVKNIARRKMSAKVIPNL